LRDSKPAVLIYTESEAAFDLPNSGQVVVKQTTDYPSQGQITIQVTPEKPSSFALHLRIPPFADGAAYQVNGGPAVSAIAGDFTLIERQWQPGDKVDLQLPMPVSVQANDHLAAVIRGPLVYCLFQDIQDKSGHIYWHHGIYPEDHELLLDPGNPASTVQEEPAQTDLLGPALRVQGHIRSRAPIFATTQANTNVLPDESESCLLLPFANQGTARGHYRVFNYYRTR
jgi:DUF1680 family protein